MNKDALRMSKAPIPGAHLTQNPKKKAWHKPPTYTAFDDVVEYFFDDVMQKDYFLPGIITLAKTNMPMTSIITSMIMGHSSKGLYTPDMGMKIAGPVYKLVTSLLDKFGVDYVTGFESPEELRSKLSGAAPVEVKGKPLTSAQKAEMEAMTEEAKEEIPEGGLMGAPTGEPGMDIPMEDEDMPSLMGAPEEDTEEEMPA
jgi:hypothetical protein